MSGISPIDGRYKKAVSELDAFFSEQALMRYRVLVEIKYLIALLNHKSFQAVKPLRKKDFIFLCGLYEDFSPRDFNQIKRIESKTKHDVNAVVELFPVNWSFTTVVPAAEAKVILFPPD